MFNETHIFELQQMASSQWGMFTTAQARGVGVARQQLYKMERDGRLERLRHGVYRFTAGEPSLYADIKAAWLAAEPEETAYERLAEDLCSCVVTGATAAYLYDAGDLWQTPFTFIVPSKRRARQADLRFLPWQIDEEDTCRLEELPTARPERLIADLVRLREDTSLIRDVARDLRDSIQPKRLSELLAPLAARNGFARNDGDALAGSLLER